MLSLLKAAAEAAAASNKVVSPTFLFSDSTEQNRAHACKGTMEGMDDSSMARILLG